MPPAAAAAAIWTGVASAATGLVVNEMFKKDPVELPKARDADGNIMDSNYYTNKSNEQLQLMKDNRQANQAAGGLPAMQKDAAPNPYEQPQQQMIQDPRQQRNSPAAFVSKAGLMGRMPS